MTTTNYESVPKYHWYEVKNRIEGDYRCHWINGKQYIRFTEEPSYELIERYDLREKGYGDMDYIRS